MNASMKITIIDDYAEREAKRKAEKTKRNLAALRRTLKAKALLDAERDALMTQPSKPRREPPEGDELVLGDMFGMRSYLASGITRFRIDDGRA